MENAKRLDQMMPHYLLMLSPYVGLALSGFGWGKFFSEQDLVFLSLGLIGLMLFVVAHVWLKKERVRLFQEHLGRLGVERVRGFMDLNFFDPGSLEQVKVFLEEEHKRAR